ncbi:MAG: transcription antitermination factor NusB [Oscillospiraceae bacterium]|nr:transcription antitermination factor NusB [Oscillospiraceae bacterium]
MNRTTARQLAIQLSFAAAASGREAPELAEEFFSPEHFETLAAEDELYAERPTGKSLDYILRLTSLTAEKREELDAVIARHAQGWRPERISRTALAVLRCAICEILYFDDVPESAAINEAVEGDKLYDTPETVAFVNGVLGGFVRALHAGEAATEET